MRGVDLTSLAWLVSLTTLQNRQANFLLCQTVYVDKYAAIVADRRSSNRVPRRSNAVVTTCRSSQGRVANGEGHEPSLPSWGVCV